VPVGIIPDAPPVARFEFRAPDERLTMNKRYHWAVRARLTRMWRICGHGAAASWRHPCGTDPHPIPLPPCLVRVTFGVPDNRRRDPHNTAPTVKAIVDGMVDAGLWPDDTPDQVTILDPVFVKGGPMVLVECWEAS
jgi:crossover junction endodeoxyribonuclease RusA